MYIGDRTTETLDLTESFLSLAHAAFDIQHRRWVREDFDAWEQANPAAFKLLEDEDRYRQKIGVEAMAAHWLRHMANLAVDFRNSEITGDETMTVQSIGPRSGISLNKVPCLLTFG